MFIHTPSYSLERTSKVLTFDPEIYYAQPNSSQIFNVFVGNTMEGSFEFNITVYVRDCILGEIKIND